MAGAHDGRGQQHSVTAASMACGDGSSMAVARALYQHVALNNISMRAQKQ